MKKTIILLLALALAGLNGSAQTLPYVVVNGTSGNLYIRPDSPCTTATPATTLAYNSKLVGSAITTNSCGYDWFRVDIPLTSAPTTTYYGVKGSNFLVSDASTDYVEVDNVNPQGLLVRASPGSGNVTIGGTNAKIWDGQRFATTGQSQTVNNHKWYEIHLTNSCSQSTGWVAQSALVNGIIENYLTHSGQTLQYTISTSSNPLAGGSASGGGTFNSGATCNLTVSANNGYTFVKWTENGSQVSASSNYNFTVNSDRTLVANFSQSCTYSLSANTFTCPSSNANNYNNVASVTTQNGCNWAASVTSGNSWLSTTSSGSGSGTISITVAANTSANSRVGTIDVNGQALTITQPGTVPLPDLTITSPSVNINDLVPYASTQVTYTINNVGTGTAGNSTTSFFLSTDNIYNSGIDTWVLNDNVDFIASTSSPTHTVTVTIPNGTPSGTWYILIIADATNSISEVSEANNTSFVSVNVGSSLQCITDDYPYAPYTGPYNDCNDSVNYSAYGSDPWSMYKFQCVSYVAWKVNQFHGVTALNPSTQYPLHNTMYGSDRAPNCSTGGSYRLSDACYWDDIFDAQGITVNNTPAVGAIAHWNSNVNGAGKYGHVAFVSSVSGNVVCYTNYNGFNNNVFTPCQFGYTQVDISQPYNATSNRKPEHYIHVEASGLGSSTGLSNIEANNFINVYPNPTSGSFTVQLSIENEQQVEISVSNILGQLIYQIPPQKVSGDFSTTISLNEIIAGVYFVRVRNGEGSVTKKIIINR